MPVFCKYLNKKNNTLSPNSFDLPLSKFNQKLHSSITAGRPQHLLPPAYASFGFTIAAWHGRHVHWIYYKGIFIAHI